MCAQRRGVAALLVALTLGPAIGVQAAPPPHQLVDYPLLWPDAVAATVAMSDGINDIAVGQELPVYSLERDGVAVALASGDLALLPFDTTDLVDRVATAEAALPEDLRQFKAAGLLDRPDLLPEQIIVTSDVYTADNRVIPPGTAIGPYRVVLINGTLFVAGLSPELYAQGVLHQRQSYPIETTDLWPKLREKLLAGDVPAESRLLQELAGHLVDADGQPVTLPDETQYIVIYSGAGWCGFSKQLHPTLVKHYEKIKADHPDVAFVFFSSDKSEAEMYTTMKSENLPWPALSFEQRLQSPFLVGQISGGTPEVIVLTRDGRMVHNGQPAGARGAQAALHTLERELARR